MAGIDLNENSDNPNKGVNLIFGPNNTDQNTMAVNIAEDENSIPEDLIPGSNDLTTGFEKFSFEKYKKWIIALVAAVLLLIGAIFAMNSGNSEIEQKLEATETEIVTENLPSFFTANLGSLPGGGEAPEGLAAPSSTNDDAEPIIDPDFDSAGSLDLEEFGIFNEDEDAGDDSTNPGTFPDDLLPAGDVPPAPSTTPDNLSTEPQMPNLNSNTAPETLMAGEMQGDTGPAAWLALIPCLGYGLLRKKK